MRVRQIRELFEYKPHWTKHLEAFTECVMRGDSPLPPGERELIAAFTSRLRNCDF
jgi:alkylhydroperoxidase family enzyme